MFLYPLIAVWEFYALCSAVHRCIAEQPVYRTGENSVFQHYKKNPLPALEKCRLPPYWPGLYNTRAMLISSDNSQSHGPTIME